MEIKYEMNMKFQKQMTIIMEILVFYLLKDKMVWENLHYLLIIQILPHLLKSKKEYEIHN